jgi:hypothetical protein
LLLISTSVFWGYRQAVEGSNRIGLGPKPDAAGREAAVAVVDQGPVYVVRAFRTVGLAI